MICGQCGTREATALVTTVVHNQLKKQALCSTCAGELEIGTEFDALAQAILGLGGRHRAPAARCATCRTSFASFKEHGRLGCPNCYEHFHQQIRDLLPRIHAGAYQHRGKTPGRR
jgi:protein arginine kinase activator